MRDKIQVEQIVNQGGLDALRKFASTFNHDVAHLDSPTFLIKIKGRAVAYFQSVMEPTIYPAISPEITPRELLEVNSVISSTIRQSYPMFHIVAEHDNFNDSIMTKLGYEKLNKRLYLDGGEKGLIWAEVLDNNPHQTLFKITPKQRRQG